MLKSKQRTQRYLYSFLSIALVSFLLILVLYRIELVQVDTNQHARDEVELTNANQLILSTLRSQVNDLTFVQDLVQQSLSEQGEVQVALEEVLISFIKTRERYFQLRWIDQQGQEQFRIDYKNGRATVTPDHELQNKSNRYYVPETLNLAYGDVYMSALDLNVEQGKIDPTHQLTLRFSTRLQSHDGTPQGMVILNYDAHDLINRLNRLNDKIWVVDQKSRWIKGPLPSTELLSLNSRFQDRYPNEWQAINSAVANSSSFDTRFALWQSQKALAITPANKLIDLPYFVGDVIHHTSDFPWHLILHHQKQELVEFKKVIHARYLTFIALFFLIYSLLILFLSNTRRLEQQTFMELRQAKRTADHANFAKTEFLSSMSHELKTPLNSILGFSQLLSMDSSLSSHEKKGFTEIVSSAKLLHALINDVLDFAKIESNQLSIHLEPVELNRLIKDCLAITQPIADKYDVNMEFISSQDLSLTVMADPTRLTQVLINLLTNACKYNRPKGHVTVSAERQAEKVIITVRDTGMGIHPSVQKELFKPFQRLGYENTNIEGTGVGLAITKQLVELMLGKITFKSEPDIGTTFSVALHYAEPLAEANNQLETMTNSLALPNQATEFHVLYIEDNLSSITFMEALLSKRPNVRLASVQDPQAGIQQAQKEQPDLILLDINLSAELDGYDVLHALREAANTKNVTIVALTANADETDRVKGMQAGFDAYITKPIAITPFYALLDRFMFEKQN